MAYRAIETTNTITHIPDGIPEGEISVLVFYPGIDVSGKQGRIYMPPLIKDGAPDWFDKYIIVIPNRHTTKWDDVKNEYEAEMNTRNLKTKNLSLGVFSGSGQNSVNIQGQIPSLGLINFMIMDPSTGSKLEKSITSLKDNNGGVYMMYNPNNWGDYPNTKNAQPGIANLVGTANAIRNNDRHMIIPTNFLKTFKDKIEPSLSSDVKDNPSEPETTTKRREKLEATFTFNVEKEDIFVIVSTGTFSTSSGTASGTTASSGIAKEIGELLMADESELFVFQDEDEFILDDEFIESSFAGEEEVLEDSEVDPEVAAFGDEFEKTTTYVPSGKYDLDLIPGEYVDNNGNKIQLCQINGSAVNVKIAEQYLQMSDAAKQAGITLKVSSGFRSPYDTISTKSEKGVKVHASSQKYLYDGYKAGKSGFNLAAAPGKSNHGNGIGFDLNTGGSSKGRFKNVNKETYIWLVKNSWKFGFVRAVSKEEWHYDYLPEKAKLGPYGKLGGGKPQKDTGSTSTKFYSKWGLDSLQGPDWGSTVNLA